MDILAWNIVQGIFLGFFRVFIHQGYKRKVFNFPKILMNSDLFGSMASFMYC